jgi:hypothetical protein
MLPGIGFVSLPRNPEFFFDLISQYKVFVFGGLVAATQADYQQRNHQD